MAGEGCVTATMEVDGIQQSALESAPSEQVGPKCDVNYRFESVVSAGVLCFARLGAKTARGRII